MNQTRKKIKTAYLQAVEICKASGENWREALKKKNLSVQNSFSHSFSEELCAAHKKKESLRKGWKSLVKFSV